MVLVNVVLTDEEDKKSVRMLEKYQPQDSDVFGRVAREVYFSFRVQ